MTAKRNDHYWLLNDFRSLTVTIAANELSPQLNLEMFRIHIHKTESQSGKEVHHLEKPEIKDPHIHSADCIKQFEHNC